jgi:hypothetical protein
MSTVDQPLVARISGIAGRYAARGAITPERQAEAVAELAAVAAAGRLTAGGRYSPV